ncbi:glucosyl-3-phosphoglycerate synthase [Carbonactinospora thermoautotrophica]|uniref:glucosyl-3-phosphoglycerate synthase n=1 Tax=Carbonactinospora thermoautotrophica TaxID=1469144 RepID=UPI00226F788D|nr:glucosyl-3-phosphoglycerate synthase [Carbonactinospora thermoautotrophica]MCX9191847.1 glucosyl-3-phosphoglycerate synthase [Carbonactinospora thermoautotrophica]
MREDVRHWLTHRTYHARIWSPGELADAKRRQNTTVSVVLPALNEERTVGAVVEAFRTTLLDKTPLIDELVVALDPGCTDGTAERARAAGARVVDCREVLSHRGVYTGKGETLWKSLFVTTGDLLVFVDADLVEFGPHFVTGLLGPLLIEPGVQFVKACYDRPLVTGGVAPVGGGRVTELAARPLLNLYWPALAGVIQPLSGEFAARRTVLELLPFPRGYGLEIGLLIDVLDLAGLDALAQVDLGRRDHRHQQDSALGTMAQEVLHTALRRLDGRAAVPAPATTLCQFERDGGGHRAVERTVCLEERPPARSLPEYHARGRLTWVR